MQVHKNIYVSLLVQLELHEADRGALALTLSESPNVYRASTWGVEGGLGGVLVLCFPNLAAQVQSEIDWEVK